MKIALLGSSYDVVTSVPENYNQEYIYSFIKELLNKGHEVTYFGVYGSKLPCEVYSLNLDSIDWGYDKDLSDNVKSYAEKQHAYFEIFKYIQESNFDIVHNLSEQQIPVFTAQFLEIPTVTTLFEKPKGLLQSSVKLNQTPKNFYVAVNHDIANSWMGHSKINEIIYSGVNYKDWLYNSESSSNNILLLSKISAQQNVESIIDAAKQGGFRLQIFGEIEDETYYEHKIKPLLNQEINYYGSDQASEYKENLNQATIAVITKEQFEKSGHFTLQALSCGTPVVVLAEHIDSDYLPEMCGTQINSNDPSVLRKAFVNTTRKSRSDCRDYVVEKFDFKKMTTDYISFYEKVLAV